MNTEKQIEKLEQEVKAIKTSFEQSASDMTMYTYENTFSTSMNAIYITPPSDYDPLKWTPLWLPTLDSDKVTKVGDERVEVTFTSEGNMNTFALLEIEVIQSGEGLRPIATERKAYSGGAKWVLVVSPNVKMVGTQGYYEWNPTILRFSVKSSVKGQLGVKMIWQ